MENLTTIIPILTAVLPPLIALIANLVLADRNPGAIRRMQRHAALQQQMPEGSAAETEFRALLDAESNKYVARVMAKMNRKINGGSLAGIILLTVFTAGATYAVILLAQVFWPAWFVAGGVALFGVLVILAGGFRSLYDTPEDIAARKAQRDAVKSARAVGEQKPAAETRAR